MENQNTTKPGSCPASRWSAPGVPTTPKMRHNIGCWVGPNVAIKWGQAGLAKSHDVTTTADAGLIGHEDREHLAFAVNAGRVVITQDVDFLRLHAGGVPHAGIAFWRQQTRSIGEVLRRLVLMHAAMSPDEMKNRVEYL